MIDKLLKFGFLILLLGALCGSYSNAQTPVCNLQFDVFELNSEQPKKAIEDVKAVLTDLATKKISKSSIQTPLFAGLTSGKYEIEIIKDGYQRRVKEFELSCKTVDEILTISKVLYLQKGNTKEVTKFGSTVFGVKDNNNQYTAKSNESAINFKAVVLTKPNYPSAARAVRASGAVQVQVTLDEDGEVTAADAISGHPLLRQAAEMAAKESRFTPPILDGQPVKIKGIIVFNFVP